MPGLSDVVFEMHLDDAFADLANPMLRNAVMDHVPDIEIGLDQRVLELVNVLHEIARRQQKLIPDLFDGDDDIELFSERDQVANLLL